MLKRFVKAVLERALNAGLTHHLGYEKHDPAGNNSGNSRNGTSGKTVKGEFGHMELEVSRDRAGTSQPEILPKHQTRFTGFDDKIISLYARGMTTREIEGHLKEIYGVEVSPVTLAPVLRGYQVDWLRRSGRGQYRGRCPIHRGQGPPPPTTLAWDISAAAD